MPSALTIALSGASGLLGQALTAALSKAGHRVLPLVRGGQAGIAWDPSRGRIDEAALAQADAVIHLAGAPVAVRWTEQAKAQIKDSRVQGTRTLAQALAQLPDPARRPLICASAVGYYGQSEAETPLTEAAPPGTGFLPEVVQAWEAAAEPAREAGLRVAHLRLGVILTAKGGALAKMLTPFKLGLGGPVGSGAQWMSFISLDDAVGAFMEAVTNPAFRGPVNVVAPKPVRQAEFAKTLGRLLKRPAFLPLPALAVRAAFGEMGQAMLLEGAPVSGERLKALGYAPTAPTLEEALTQALA